MTDGPTMRLATNALTQLDYDEPRRSANYPVWLAATGTVVRPPLVAFGRPTPQDMSTATVVVAFDRATDDDFACARQLAAPALLLCSNNHVEVFGATNGRTRVLRIHADDLSALQEWRPILGPRPLLQAKRGLRQLRLFPIELHSLFSMRRVVEETLVQRVESVLNLVRDLRTTTPHPSYGSAEITTQITFGALAAVALSHRSRTTPIGNTSYTEFAVQAFQNEFEWITALSPRDFEVLQVACEELADGIDYRSIDARVLGDIYENTLTNRNSGKYYTPSRLVTLILNSIPFEAMSPEARVVHDPSCGSGTFLVHTHERLSELAEEETPDLLARQAIPEFSISGADDDVAAIQIAQLRLLLADARARLTLADSLNIDSSRKYGVIVGNPPWKGKHTGHVWDQRADQFVASAIHALQDSGMLAIVLPASWLRSRSQYAGRNLLRETCDIFEIWRLPESTFASARQAPAVVFAQKTARPKGKALVRHIPHVEALATTYTTGRFEFGLLKDSPLEENNVLGGYMTDLLAEIGDTVPLSEVGEVATGPQPRARFMKTEFHETTHFWLLKTKEVPYLHEAHSGQLTPFNFPGDCADGSTRGQSLVSRPKIIIPETRDPKYPWRLRPLWGGSLVVPTNKAQMIAARDDRDAVLEGLLVVLASGVASAWITENTVDQHISAPLLRRLPLPPIKNLMNLSELAKLARFGTEDIMPSHCQRIENAVLEAYGLSGNQNVHDYLSEILGTTPAPEHSYRYRRHADTQERLLDDDLDGPVGVEFRRTGAALDAHAKELRMWVACETPDEGTWVRLPPRILGYLCRPHIPFEATDEESLEDAHYRTQILAYIDLDRLVQDAVEWDR